MAMNVKINFDDVYDISMPSNEITLANFETELTDGSKKKLIIKVGPQAHELMPNVYNLAFGPPDDDGNIDDKAQMNHVNYSMVFSTILLHAKLYLTVHPDRHIGIDGSNNSRAFLYYRFMLNNFNYLTRFFTITALKYYVRITRFGKYQYDNPFDFDDIVPELIELESDSPTYPEHMYNYFVLSPKKAINSGVLSIH